MNDTFSDIFEVYLSISDNKCNCGSHNIAGVESVLHHMLLIEQICAEGHF